MTEHTDETTSSARGERRKAALVQAGIDILVEDGWPGLTHRRVGARAGANPALLQYHFGTLVGLRAAIARHASAALIRPVAEHLDDITSIDEMAHLAADFTVRSESDERGARLLTQIVVGAAYYPEVADIVRRDLADAEQAIADRLCALDPRWLPEAAREAGALLLSAMDGSILHAVTAPRDRRSAPSTGRITGLYRTILTP